MKVYLRKPSGIILAALCLLLTLLANNARAALNYWDPNGTTSTLTPTGNFEDTAWAPTAARTASLAVFAEGTAAAFTVTNTTGGGTNGTYTVTVNANHTVAGIFNGAATGTSGSTNLILSGSGVLSIASGLQGFGTQLASYNTVIRCSLGGTGGIENQNSGSLYLAGNNTYSGGTTLDTSAGLNFNNNNSFGTGPITWLASTTVLATPATDSTSTAFATAPITLPNSVTAISGTQILVGIAAAPVTFNGPWTFPTSGTVTFQNQPAGTMVTIAGVMSAASGTAGFTKPGAGTVVLSGLNTYAGATAVTGGILSVSSLNKVSGGTTSSSLGHPLTAALGTINIGTTTTAATLVYTGVGETSDRVINLNGTTGGATIEQDGTGALTLSSAFTATGAGAKTLTLQGTSTAANTISGAIVNSTSATALTKTQAGSWTLSGVNTFTGNMTISGGTLTIGGAGKLGSGSYAGTIANTASFVYASSAAQTLSGVISGTAGKLTQNGSGTLTLSVAETYTGLTTVNGGTLALTAAGSLSASSSILVASGATLDVSGRTSTTFTLGSSASLTAIGASGVPATINGASAGSVSLGSRPVTLSFVPTAFTGDTANPALTISQGSLTLSANGFTVTNASATPLGAGIYTLLTCPGGITGTPNVFVNVNGTGLAVGMGGAIQVNGNEVDLVVSTLPAFSGLTTSQSISYGTASISLSGTLSAAAGPTYPATGETISVTIDGVAQSTMTSDAFGDFTLVYTTPTIPASGTAYTITYSYAGDASLSPATDTSTTLTVTKVPVTVTANPQSKTYGQTVTFGTGSTLFTPSGLQNGQTIGTVTLAVSGSGGAATAPVSGSPYIITPSAATGGTFVAADYTITYVTNSLTLAPAPLTVTGNNVTNLYGAPLPIFGVTFTGFVNSQTLGTSDVGGSPSLITAATSSSPIGTYDITNSLGTLTSTNYSFVTFVDGALTIDPLPVVLTGTRPYDETATAALGILSISNVVGSDDVSLASGSAVLAGSGAGVENITDFTALTLGGTTATNYTLTNATGSVTITTLPLSITANPQVNTYGSTLVLGTSAFSVGSGLFGSETVTAVTLTANGGTAPTDPVSGSPYTITPSAATGANGFLAANYNITYVTNSLTLSPALLTVTASPESKTYGQTVTFGGGSSLFTSSALQNGEMIGTVTLSGSGGVSNAPVSGSPYAITPSAAAGGTFNPGNYSITYNNGLLTVNPAPLTVTANSYTNSYGATNPVFTATFASFVNGETLGTSDIGGSPSLTTGVTTNSPIGTYDITNSIGTLTSTNYSFVSFVDGTLTVTPLVVVVTGTRPYDGTATAAFGILSVSNVVGSDDVNIASGSAVLAGANAGVENITDLTGLTLGGTTSSNYTLTGASGAVTITGAPLTITANSQVNTYGSTLVLGTSAFSVGSGLVSPETVTAVTLNANGGTTPTALVSGSPYVITPSAATGANGFLAANYNITYVTNSLVLNPLPVVLTGTRAYDGTTTAAFGILSVANAINGDDVNVASGSGTLASAAVGTEPINSFGTLALGGTTAGNYTLSGASGSVIVTGSAPYAITSVTASGGNINVVFQSVSGVTYQMLSTTNAHTTLATWTNEGPAVLAAGTLTTNVVANHGGSKFYIIKH